MTTGTEAEVACLSSALLNLSALDYVCAGLSERMFADTKHQAIFAAMAGLKTAGQPVNRLTLRRELERLSRFGEAGGIDYLMRITEFFPVVENIRAYITLVVEDWQRREAMSLSRELHQQLGESRDYAGQLIRDYAGRLSDVVGSEEPADNKHWTSHAMDHEERLLDRNGDTIGWPWPEVTEHLGPFLGDQLTIIGGLTSHGKTHASVEAALKCASRGLPTKFYSLEMDKVRLAHRLNWIQTGLNPRTQFTLEQRIVWNDGYEAMRKMPLYVEDRDEFKDFSKIIADIELSVRKHGIKLVVIDYLRQMRHRSFRASDVTAAVAEMGVQLKSIVKRLKIDLILLHQINKSTGSNKQRPTVYDLEYGAEKDADSVLIVNRPGNYLSIDDFKGNEEAYKRAVPFKNYSQFIIAKARNGETGLVRMGFDERSGKHKPYMVFTEAAAQ